MLSSHLGSLLNRSSQSKRESIARAALATQFIETPAGTVRVYDSGSDEPCVILVPDGPNVIEHYEHLISLMKRNLRVVCFDMPGFGFSFPKLSYEHTLNQGAGSVLSVMDALQIAKATLAFTCANGLYALRVAQLAPQRIRNLVLAQTPSLNAMHTWTKIVPRPVHIPIVGQIFSKLGGKRFATVWYPRALPKTTDSKPFLEKSLAALSAGSCFCLAGVAQGLKRENEVSFNHIKTPCTMFWGGQDRSHKRTDPNSLLALVPQAEIVRFDDCGHFPDIEQPERFASILLDRMAMPYTTGFLEATEPSYKTQRGS